MKETLNQRLFNTWVPKCRVALSDVNNHRASIIIFSLLGAWITCIPYEGQLLYTLAQDYGIESSGLLDISLVMQVVGLILGGIFLKTLKAARNIIIYAIPVCILCTVTFFFPSYEVWLITLTICSTLAGVCISASGNYIKSYIIYDNRFRTAAVIIISSNILKLLVNNITLYVSIQIGFLFTIIMLGAAWYLAFRMPLIQNEKTSPKVFDKKTGFKALILLFLFIALIAVDFGITIEIITPHFKSFEWMTSWYWILPYAGTAFIIKRLKDTEYRGSILYVALGMIGFGFISFVMHDHSIFSYLIVNTVLWAAWAINDTFWFSILLDMLDMVRSSARILSVGFSAIMIGVLVGKIIAYNNLEISEANPPIIPMAVIFTTLVILPILHKLLSEMIKKNEKLPNIIKTEKMDLPNITEILTEREKQIASLLIKGRTYKLIAAELQLSENTVKTHIKNIYSKLEIESKSELFNFLMK